MPRKVHLLPECPECGTTNTNITSTTDRPTGHRRYRKCNECGHSFVTMQTREFVVPKQQQHNRTLSDETVREMRGMAADGHSSYAVAFAFDLEQKVAYNAITGRTYAHVE